MGLVFAGVEGAAAGIGAGLCADSTAAFANFADERIVTDYAAGFLLGKGRKRRGRSRWRAVEEGGAVGDGRVEGVGEDFGVAVLGLEWGRSVMRSMRNFGGKGSREKTGAVGCGWSTNHGDVARRGKARRGRRPSRAWRCAVRCRGPRRLPRG